MKRPVIGMVPAYDPNTHQCFLRPQYAKAIQAAGGLAFILPLTQEAEIMDEIADLYDGFLFTGGADLSPELYGEKPLPCTGDCVKDRENTELALMKAVLKKGKPVLGICRGMQFLNVYFGGSLFQDVLEQKPGSHIHWQKKPYETPSHTDSLIPDTPLQTLLEKDTLPVNSMHHQGIKEIGQDLLPMAISDDGLVEAIYHTGYPFVWGLQWHPEFLYDSAAEHLRLFEAFIEAAQHVKANHTD